MAVVGDRAAALSALASGGTAGLDAYKEAQSKQADYQRQAIDSALNRGVGIPSGAADEVRSLIGSRTSGFRNDAASGVGLATEQMGYDSSALDSFLANQQKKLDEQRRQAEQNMDISRTQHAGRVAAWQRQYDAEQASKGDGSLASWFAQMDKEEQDALVKGTAQALQGQEMSKAQEQADMADDEKLSALKRTQRHQQEHPETVDVQGTGVLTPEALAAARTEAQQPLAQEIAARQAFYEQASQWGGQNAILAALEQMRLRAPDYEQKAATELYGMNPLLAMGRYPNDEKAITERRKELDAYDSYIPGAEQADAQVAYNADQDALYRDAWEQEGLNWDANKAGAQSAGLSPTTAGSIAKTEAFADAAAAAEDWRTKTDKTAAQRYAGFEDEIIKDYPGEENAAFRQYVLGYFQRQIMTGNRDIYSVTDPAATGG